MMDTFPTERAFALEQDREDPLVRFREEFYTPPDTIYLDGNSLGLLPREAERSLLRILKEWKEIGINGWLEGRPPWFYFAERVGEQMAPLVGAQPSEVIATGTTTANIHALLSSFFHPSGTRTRILADSENFPSDLYALKSHLRLHGLDPKTHLITIGAGDDLMIDEDRIISAMGRETALVFLPSVLFRTGQLLDIGRISRAAHEQGILFGLDCSHSAGVVDHDFERDQVDFATWCGYKYLNGGPGSTAFLYVNRKHFSRGPGMAGWFGYKKERQFLMDPDFDPEFSAGGWQISTPNLLSLAPLEGSLSLFEQAGITKVREKSLRLTSYLMSLADHFLAPLGFYLRTPREEFRRGGHVALGHPTEAWRISQALKARRIIPDFRPPDIIRLAPVPLYNTFSEVWETIQAIREIAENEEYKSFDPDISAVS